MEKRWEWLGKKIRKMRKDRGFKTQAALAKQVGTDRTRVSRWESGAEFPETFRVKLSEVLKVSEEFFKEVPINLIEKDPAILAAVERGALQAYSQVAGSLPPAKQKLIGLIPGLDDGVVRQILKLIDAHGSNESKNHGRSRR